MNLRTASIHHVTAIAASLQRNPDFYEGSLGLRLVKKTVSFDDPGTYHLYYGDEIGHPGTILTFFPWPGAGSSAGGPRDSSRRPPSRSPQRPAAAIGTRRKFPKPRNEGLEARWSKEFEPVGGLRASPLEHFPE